MYQFSINLKFSYVAITLKSCISWFYKSCTYENTCNRLNTKTSENKSTRYHTKENLARVNL